MQLKRGDNPIRDNELTLDISILQASNGNVLFTETHQRVWTNYDGYIDIDLGSKNSTAWKNIDWNSGVKKVRIEGRAFGAPASQNSTLHEDELPMTAYAQYPKYFERPNVGSIKFFSDRTHPNIEIRGNSPSNNFPYLDFSTNDSDEDRDFVARLRPGTDRNFYLYSRAGGLILRKAPLATQISLYTRDNAFVQLRGGTPYLDFYPSNASGTLANGRIILTGSNLEVSSFNRKNIWVNAGSSRKITYTGNEHKFNGGPIEVTGSGRFGADNYTLLAYRDISVGLPDYGQGIYYGVGCDCSTDGNYVPFNTRDRLGTGSGNPLYSIKTSQGIRATYFHAYSDERIKITQGLSENEKDLALLKQLRTTRYLYKDPIQNGVQEHLGFLAQEVEQVVPGFVSKTKNVIPDIYRISEIITLDNNSQSLEITLDTIFDLKVGDRIQVLGNAGHLVEVVDIHGFTIKVKDWPEEDTKKVFVYGREVSDFRTVDYDQIFTLNVSATQALVKEVDKLKSQVVILQSNNELLLSNNRNLKNEIQQVNERLDNLTRLVTSKIASSSSNSLKVSN